MREETLQVKNFKFLCILQLSSFLLLYVMVESTFLMSMEYEGVYFRACSKLFSRSGGSSKLLVSDQLAHIRARDLRIYIQYYPNKQPNC
jgi:hypothetical protein